MAIVGRDQLDALVAEIHGKKISQVYLLFGERFLCQQAAGKITRALLEDGGNVQNIDGSQEDFSVTIGKITSFSLFPGRQVYRVNDTGLFHSVKNTQSLWKKSLSAHRENNIPLARSYLRAMLEASGLDADDPANDPGTMPAARWKKLFGFTRPGDDLAWTGNILQLSAGPDEEKREIVTSADPQQLFEEKITAGLPGQNILLLLSEDVDKRKRLFKTLADRFTVVDLSVESGSSSRAQKSQHAVLLQVLRETLGRYGKTMAPDISELLFERIGFHPVALAMETEKLALYTGSRSQILREDIDTLTGRTRQDAPLGSLAGTSRTWSSGS